MKPKSKFNKKRCMKCKWSSRVSYGFNNDGFTPKEQLCCMYKKDTGNLVMIDKKVVDLRGDDYDNCKLFERK